MVLALNMPCSRKPYQVGATMHTRRKVVSGLVSLGVLAAAGSRDALAAIPAPELGLRPGEGGDQSVAFERAVREAAQRGRALLLPPGNYIIGDVVVDDVARIVGQRGARLVCAPGAHRMVQFRGREAGLRNLVLDGRMQAPGNQENDRGLVYLRDVEQVHISRCRIEGAGGHGLALDGCGGIIEKCTIRKVADAAIFSIAGTGLKVRGNNIADCGNGGILIWQWDQRPDGSVVSGNRIRHIRADAGGNGQNGNGVNVFRAGNVQVVGNDIADCAFSAVRNNAGHHVSIVRNRCLRLGEVAIFVEFEFYNALVERNIIDDAATGISVTNLREGGHKAKVVGNVVRNIRPVFGPEGEQPCAIAAEGDVLIQNNLLENSAFFGLLLGWGPYLRNVRAVRNTIRRARVGAGVSVVEGAGRATLISNIFEDVDVAVAGYRYTQQATEELVGARQVPPNIRLRGNVVR